MDQVLKEEQAKLNEVEGIIDSAAEASRVKGDALSGTLALENAVTLWIASLPS